MMAHRDRIHDRMALAEVESTTDWRLADVESTTE